MSWVTFWKFLHIAFMFGAVGLFVGGGILNNRVQQSGDVRAMRTVIAAESRLAPVAGVLMVLGIIFGFVTAVADGLDLLAPWLLLTYGLILVVILIGALYHGPQDKKLGEAVAASSDDQPSRQLTTLIAGSPGRRVVNVVDGLLWAAIIFVMVVKPFGLG
jgi:protein-S-isoprenylcysteine O-methyltransferase Ste14